MHKKWYIVPRLIIDRELYKGHGRPRKSDYRVYPHPDGRDLYEPMFVIKSIRRTKDKYHIKAVGHFEARGGLIGSQGK